MSANPYKTIIIDDIKYKLVPVDEEKEKILTIEELAKKTKISKHTIYKKVNTLTLGVHYFKPNGGKLLFDESAIDFLIKGGNNGESLHERGQSICLDNIFPRKKTV